MSDLISRKALIGILTKYKFGAIKSESEREYTKETVLNFVKEQSTVEAVQVVHGEWLDFYGDYSTAECDQCAECYEVSPDSEPKKEYFEAFKQCYNFCPNCGADMRKKV